MPSASNHHKDLTASKASKLAEERMWSLALLFLEGRQSVEWDKNLKQYASLRTGGNKQVTVNLLLNVYRNIAARLATAYPSVVVLPATPSTDDVIKAVASETAVRSFWQSANMRSVISTVVSWLLTAGNTAIHTYFNPETGNVEAKAIDPFNLFYEPGAESPDESDWVAIRSYFTPRMLAKAYPDAKADIERLSLVDPTDARLFGKPYSSQQQTPSRVEVYETYWQDGTHKITAGNVTLFEGATNLPTVPIELIQFTAIPRRLWGVSLMQPLLEMQWLYNRFRSQMLLNVELMSNPKWLIPTNAGVDAGAFTNRGGEKIYYNGSAKAPTQVPGAPLPQYVVDNIAKLQSEIQDVAGVHSVSLGKRSMGVHSGAAIDALSARDGSQLQLTQAGIEHACKNVAKTAILLMRQHFTKPKMLRVFDAFGKVVSQQIKGTDLVESPEVYFQAGSLFRDEAQDRDAKVLDLVKLGIMDKADAQKEISLHIGGKGYLREVADLAHAKDILEAATQGREVEIFRSDNLSAFTRVFEEYMRSGDYYDLDEERMDYIRDIYIAVSSGGDPASEAEAQAKFKVFPSASGVEGDPGKMAEVVVAPQSATAEAQQAEEVLAAQSGREEAQQAERLFKAMQPEMERAPDGETTQDALSGRGITT